MEVVRPMQNIIKKTFDFKWNESEKDAFARIKRLISKSPALLSFEFSKDFYLYTFASDLSYAGVLTQKMIKNTRFLFCSLVLHSKEKS